MRTITNDYRDAQIVDLGSGGQRGPFLVMQTGVSPNDSIPKTYLFVLQPDGRWANFNAYACQGRPEALDGVVFPALTDVMQTFGRLRGRVQVADLPIDEAGLQAWLERQKGVEPLQAARAWAIQYRERRRKS